MAKDELEQVRQAVLSAANGVVNIFKNALAMNRYAIMETLKAKQDQLDAQFAKTYNPMSEAKNVKGNQPPEEGPPPGPRPR